jgi:hypothetical protein
MSGCRYSWSKGKASETSASTKRKGKGWKKTGSVTKREIFRSSEPVGAGEKNARKRDVAMRMYMCVCGGLSACVHFEFHKVECRIHGYIQNSCSRGARERLYKQQGFWELH